MSWLRKHVGTHLLAGTVILVAATACGEREAPESEAVSDTSAAASMTTVAADDTAGLGELFERGPSCMDARKAEKFRAEAFTAAFQRETGVPIRSENEVHDCQRLLRRGSPRDTYGPLVTLFVSDALPVTLFVSDALPGAGGYGVPKVVAVITTDSVLPELNIDGLKNCVYLRQMQSGLWSGAIVPIPAGGCPAALPANAKPLEVTTYNQTETASFPVAGRIHEGPNYKYFFGIQCQRGLWCVLGKGNVPTGHVVATHARGDKQRLAYWDGSVLTASRLTATLSPVSGLADITQDAFEQAGGVKVATIRITGSDDEAEKKYLEKWKLPATLTRLPRTLDVYLRRDRVQDLTQGWQLRYTLDGEEIPFRQHAKKHGGPGTTRFRWLQDDEGVWIQCLKGCCGEA
jgi:hypothetical protein